MVAPIRIVSSGQTGAERAALGWAIANCVPHGGWCPKGRKADDGEIPARYELTETPRATYAQCREWNARDSDGTVIFTVESIVTSDFQHSVRFALNHDKPVLHVCQVGASCPVHETLGRFVEDHGIKVLNIAGSKLSTEPDVAAFVREVLEKAWPSPLRLFSTPDSHHLRAAHGWLELGNHLEAHEELERIEPGLRGHPDVMEARCHVQAHTKNWLACVDLANAILKLDPERSQAWIHRSFALHALRRTQEAFEELLPVATRFPEVWTIPYNLACYCAQLGRLKESLSWFKKAMAIDEDTVRRAGLDDDDLKPLRDSMSSTFGKDPE